MRAGLEEVMEGEELVEQEVGHSMGQAIAAGWIFLLVF